MPILTLQVSAADGPRVEQLLDVIEHSDEGDEWVLSIDTMSSLPITDKLEAAKIPFIAVFGGEAGEMIVGGMPELRYRTWPMLNGDLVVTVNEQTGHIRSELLDRVKDFLDARDCAQAAIDARATSLSDAQVEPRLTKEEYINDYQGELCPWCEDCDDLHCETDFIGDGLISVTVQCPDCDKSWTEKYRLFDADFYKEGAD